MPKLAANVSTLFKELPFLERFAAAAKAGFRAVEYQYPYASDAADVAAAVRDAGLQVVLHNMPPGDAARGEHGTGCLLGREARFREDLEQGIAYAQAVGCPRLHCMAGVPAAAADSGAAQAVFVANLRYAGQRLGEARMQLLVEPLSDATVKGYFLTGSAQAVRILDETGAANAWLQYDLFHMQRMEGNLADSITRLLPRIGHMQIADVPGRHEPGTGELNFEFLLAHIDRAGYSGWVGCEYNPRGDTVEGLKWARHYLTKS